MPAMGKAALCHKSKNLAFINPRGVPEPSVSAALKMCQHCPHIKECAKTALRSGTTLDGGRQALGRDIIAAGIILPPANATGDAVDDAARALAKIAGTRPPTYVTASKRFVRPRECRECGEPMVPWTRDRVPEGKVMHYAQGWCTNCRGAYKAGREARRVNPLRKPVDRKRHHRDTAEARAATAARRAGKGDPRLTREERIRHASEVLGYDCVMEDAMRLTERGSYWIRDQVKAGRLTVMLLPGTRVRRFRSRELLALRQEVGPSPRRRRSA